MTPFLFRIKIVPIPKRTIIYEISLSPPIFRAIFGGFSKKKRLQRLNYLLKPEINKQENKFINMIFKDILFNFNLFFAEKDKTLDLIKFKFS